MKKLRLLSLMVLLLTLVLAGCDSDSGGDSGSGGADTWSNITSLAQANGTWRGSYSETNTIRNWYTYYSDDYWDPEMQQIFGNMNVKMDIDVTYIINASQEVVSGTERITFTFSGGNINDVWPLIREELADSGMTVNNSNHSISSMEPFGPEPISIYDLYGMQINQSGNRVRMPTEVVGLDGNGYIIMTKQ